MSKFIYFQRLAGGIMKRHSKKVESGPRSQYVITGQTGQTTSISSLLKRDFDIVILDEIDNSTALVEMSEETHRRIAGKFPNIVVEPNRAYSLLIR